MNYTVEYKYTPQLLFILVSSLIVILLLGALFLHESEVWRQSVLGEWAYAGLFLVTFSFVLSLVVVQLKNNIFKRHISIPSVLFLTFMGYYVYLGSLDHYFQVQSGARFVYNESINAGYYYFIVSISSWCTSYLFFSFLFTKLNKPKNHYQYIVSVSRWNKARLWILIVLFGFVGVVFFAIFYIVYIKGFPVLQGVSPNASAELRRIVINEGHNAHLLAFNSMTMVLIYSAVYMIVFDKKPMIVILFILAIISFLLWGARIYIIIPFLMFFPYFVAVKKYSIRKVLLIGFTLIALASVYGTVRNLSFYAERGQEVSGASALEKMASIHIAPEFRDTLGVVSHLEELQEQYSPSAYMSGVFYTALPGKILGIFGVDKQALFDDQGTGSGWLIAKVTRGYDWGGIRPGIMSQTLMAFGLTGVIVLFLGYGMIFAFLDVASKRLDLYSPDRKSVV